VTTTAIMQPTYLPWLGYLDLIDQVDVFVLLDRVQLDHRSWQHRNRIRTEQGLTWLTVPVAAQDKRARLDEVAIGASEEFPARHLNLLATAYEGQPGWDEVQDVVEPLRSPPARLVDLTIPLIRRTCAHAGITTPLVAASTLPADGHRGGLLASLADAVGADRYLSPPGSVAYLVEDRQEFERRGIEVLVHRFEHPTYEQRYEPFLSHASSIDLVGVSGGDAVLPAVHGGRRPAVALDDAAAQVTR
jgi:hypothetical protein